MAGTLGAARTGHLRAPMMFISAVFLIEAAGIALIPYLGGEAGAAAALCAVGACNGLGNVTALTVLQKWVPPGLLGRVMGTLMLCSFGSFPLSVAVSGVLVHHLGPTPFFPVAGGPGRGGHPGRADAAGVPGLRGGREREGPGGVSRSGGNADGGLKPGPVRHLKIERALSTAGRADCGGRRSGAGQGVTAPARSASMMASVTSAVPAVPPTSRVR